MSSSAGSDGGPAGRERTPADPTLAKPSQTGALVGAQNFSAGSSRKDASEQGPTAAQPRKDGGLDDPLVAFTLLEALRANDLPALDKLLDCLPPSPASPGFGSNLSPLTKTPMVPQNWPAPAAPALVPVHLSPLHLAIQVSSVETAAHILARRDGDVNAQNSKGDTPLHLAARAGRVGIVDALLADHRVNDAVRNAEGKLPDEVAKTHQIAEKIRANRETFAASRTVMMHQFAHSGDFASLKNLFTDPRTAALADINHQDPIGGATVLHAAVQRETGSLDVVRWLLDSGADVFIRDRRGKLPFELAKNEKVRTMLKQLTKGTDPSALTTITAPGKPPKMQGLLQKWTNYAAGYKTRWFVLENGILSYYRKQEDTDNACRGSVSLRIAKLSLDPSDPQKFELIGRGSVRYHLRAEHAVEAKRWIFAITQTKQWLDESADKAYNSNKGSAASSIVSLPVGEATAEGTSAPNVAVLSHEQGRSDDSVGSSPHDASGDAGAAGRQSLETAIAERRGREPIRQEIQDADRSRSPSPEFSSRPPHATAFESVVTNINVQLELLCQFLDHLQKKSSVEGSSAKEPGSAVHEAARRSVEQVTGMVAKLVRFATDREVFWKKKYQDEREKQNLFAEGIRELALENHLMEQAVRGKMRQNPKAPPVHQPSRKMQEDPAAEGPMAVLATAEHELDSGEEDEDVFEDALAEDEFFSAAGQALQAGDVGGALSAPDACEIGATSTAQARLYSEVAESGQPEKIVKKSAVFAVPGYPPVEGLRKWLPLPENNSAPEISLWSVIKNSIGKDLTKITLPVYFNEPLSMLQRMAEDVEYIELLDKGAAQRGSTERILYVAAFAISNYSSTVERTGKPFNPLLSETYELSIPDKGFRYVSEQVSHHPPISACHCESPNYEFFAEVNVRSKFYGKSLELHPLGVSHVNLKVANAWRPEGVPEGEDGKFVERYSFRKVTTCVNNLIYGKLRVDHYGEMVIQNHTTGDVAVLNFKAKQWREKVPCEIKGEVKAAGVSSPVWEIWGRWDQKLIARRVVTTSQPPLNELHQQATESELPTSSPSSSRASAPGHSLKHRGRPVLLWRRNPMPERPTPFNLTPFAMALNDAPEELTRYLCPTDCRFRPDQRAMERGEWATADSEKTRLEVKQRNKRIEREKAIANRPSTSSLSQISQDGEHGQGQHSQREHRPKWFTRSTDSVTGEEFWKFDHEYWRRRERCVAGEPKAEVWPDVEDLY